jgi:hypothetical protein
MTPESAFQIVNGAAPLAWIAMIAAPHSNVVRRVVLSGTFVAILASAYALIIVIHFNFDGADFMSLEGVMALLNDPWAMTAGWIHYLAFDLLAGILVTRKGLTMGIPRLWLLPCQLGCFMLGPVGILMFIGAAKVRGNRWQDIALN